MFHSVILCSLIVWKGTRNSCLHQLEVLQNKFIRACLFLPRSFAIDSLYVKFQTLKLNGIIRLEIAKFIFKSKNSMLPLSFNNDFVNLNKIHKHNIRQKLIAGILSSSI